MDNEWYVITGAPCSGKTTVLNGLVARGYNVVPEIARAYIDESLAKGVSVEELRKDEVSFQKEILHRKIEEEKKLLPHTIVFFDRGIPDTWAYLVFHGIKDKALLQKSLLGKYQKVFILDPCPFKKDYARIETEADQKELHRLIVEGYDKTGIPIVHVPILETKEARVDFILKHL